MHLAVRKAEALIEQHAATGASLEALTSDELACYVEVIEAAVAATTKVIEDLTPKVSDSGRADEAQATV